MEHVEVLLLCPSLMVLFIELEVIHKSYSHANNYCHRRLWKSIPIMHFCTHLYWRWWRNDQQSRSSSSRFIIYPISPDRYLWCWLFNDIRMQRRRRYIKKFFGLKIYDKIRSNSTRFSFQRCCKSSHDNVNSIRQRMWT